MVLLLKTRITIKIKKIDFRTDRISYTVSVFRKLLEMFYYFRQHFDKKNCEVKKKMEQKLKYLNEEKFTS